MGRRVLFTTTGGLGRVLPSVALARAVMARGHDVMWAAPPDAVGHVRRAGIDAVAIGTARLPGAADARRRYPESDSLPPHEVPAAMFGKPPCRRPTTSPSSWSRCPWEDATAAGYT